MKKVGFVLNFYYLDTIFLKDKENNKKRVKELGDRYYFSTSFLFNDFYYFCDFYRLFS